ncbi:cytochrome b-c1 complex subunit 6-like [Gossypium australe]|uniref:Complex III subunit VI n=1 Tax=Gossypium australe TaxID=47621 RepID=A0A5B6US33_9ROSI|nr:cytochrome b-c1 complex subunit 6-like [Gossypium australe]
MRNLISGVADEEPVDQKKYLEEGCKPKCVKQLRAYEFCGYTEKFFVGGKLKEKDSTFSTVGDSLAEHQKKGKRKSWFFKELACVKRIEGDESGHKHCTGQYFDYWACIDKCMLRH